MLTASQCTTPHPQKRSWDTLVAREPNERGDQGQTDFNTAPRLAPVLGTSYLSQPSALPVIDLDVLVRLRIIHKSHQLQM